MLAASTSSRECADPNSRAASVKSDVVTKTPLRRFCGRNGAQELPNLGGGDRLCAVTLALDHQRFRSLASEQVYALVAAPAAVLNFVAPPLVHRTDVVPILDPMSGEQLLPHTLWGCQAFCGSAFWWRKKGG
ncbi:hypothetical protein MELA_02989 [Candidatus Methylomirabilis lanthanidiphila]|uniref:Uncharacterized protein n=1 Tax=Candidatus Methylomirabilis lanthanidiphila TaxID=2211376 RepID=A0A564ZMN9_9BACT|nr:hypothetical protein MELA_02989 [Candidatus Methylomirabilis lanthanidiphila]